MKKRTKWSIGLTIGLGVLAIGVIVWQVASDNPEITPELVRETTKAVEEVTLGLIAAIWLVWYWMGRREGDGPR
jgi:hypothetical protein